MGRRCTISSGRERKGMGRKGRDEEERIGKAMRFGGAAHEQNTYSAKPCKTL